MGSSFLGDFELLLEASSVAAHHGEHQMAMDLVQSAEVLHPKHRMCHLSRGYALIHNLKYKEAARELTHVIHHERKDEATEFAKLLLAVCYFSSTKEDEKGREICKSVLASSDEDSKALAQTILDHATQFPVEQQEESPLSLSQKSRSGSNSDPKSGSISHSKVSSSTSPGKEEVL